MRKWIIAGLAAFALVGIVACVLSQPKDGSVEYHKKEYLKESRAKLLDKVLSYAPIRVQRGWGEYRMGRVFHHRERLKKLGYFEERVFVLSNRSPYAVRAPFYTQLQPCFASVTTPFCDVIDYGTNSVTIEGPRHELDAIGNSVRKFDVPEN